MATSEPNEALPDLKDVHWREYPVGFTGELAHAVSRTLMPFLIGVGVTFALILVTGILGEEGLVEASIAEPLNLLFRMSAGVLLGVAYLAWLVVSIAVSLRHTTTSKALAVAASSNAPQAAVPHPSQVEHVVEDGPWFPILIFAFGHVFLAVLVVCTALTWLDGNDEFGSMMLLGGLAVAAAMTAIIILVFRRVNPAHLRRRKHIARHWTTRCESAAWQAARRQSKHTVSSDDFVDHGDRLKLGTRLTGVGAVLSALAVVIFYIHAFITHPEAKTFRYSYEVDAGPRAEYSEAFEAVLAVALWTTVALGAAALIAFLAGALIEAKAHAAERAGLRDAMENPAASRPPTELLARYAERHPVRLAQVAAILGGIGLIFGPATILLGTIEMDDFSGGMESFVGLTEAATIVTIASAVLVLTALVWNAVANVRGQELRNRLMSRWPSLPPQKPDSEGNVAPARKGPALAVNGE